MRRTSEPNDWTPKTGDIDRTRFEQGKIGPYRLGPTVRRTRFGELVLAITDDRDQAVLEIDLFDALRDTELTAPRGTLMADIAQVSELRHRRISPVVGSGFDEGVPYVVRPHKLGVTLEQLLERTEELPSKCATAILYGVAEAIDFLAEQGSAPGACSMGGFTAQDIFLGFDGDVVLVGLGLKAARAPQKSPVEADLFSLFALARTLDDHSTARLSGALAGTEDLAAVVRAVRKRDRDACGHGRMYVAQALRETFADRIIKDREFFGLTTLH